MTQQSLITRLKAVEEALADPAIYCSEDICKVDDGEFCCRAKQKYALSDLRELIQEVETRVDDAVAECYIHLESGERRIRFLVDFDTIPVGRLYTALGEKP